MTSGQIDWLQFVNNIYSLINSDQRIEQDDICFVPFLEYFRQLPEILSQTSNRIIANFLGFKLVSWYGDYTAPVIRELNYDIEIPPSWMTCLELIRDNMGFALSRKYIEKNFSQIIRIEVICYSNNFDTRSFLNFSGIKFC